MESTDEHRQGGGPRRRSVGDRVRAWATAFKFAAARAGSAKDVVRLFYHIALKPPLVWRGWRKYSPKRVLSFSLKAAGGRRFPVWVRDNGLEAGTIAEFFSPGSIIVPRDLPPFQPSVVYDIGANVGIATLYFAELYPAASIYAFEPLPANYEICALNCKSLKKAQAFPWAVGSKNEVTSFECNDDPRGGHLQANPGIPKLAARGHIEVQVVTVAELVRSGKAEPADFIKIDVEGAEMEVLKGLGEAAGVRRIFVETHGDTLKQQCIQWLQEHGFRIHGAADPTAVWGDRV